MLLNLAYIETSTSDIKHLIMRHEKEMAIERKERRKEQEDFKILIEKTHREFKKNLSEERRMFWNQMQDERDKHCEMLEAKYDGGYGGTTTSGFSEDDLESGSSSTLFKSYDSLQ